MENKLYFVTGNFNLNCLEFHQCSEIRQFSNNMLEKGANPLINRPTRVTTSSARPIDIFKKGIIKTSISDHFTIFAAIKLPNEKTKNWKIKIKKRFFSDKNKVSFKQDILKINWEELNILNCRNILYENFIKIYSYIYDKNFPLLETEVKLKDLLTPWMSKAMKKTWKQDQKLYIKFQKSRRWTYVKKLQKLLPKIKEKVKANLLFEPIKKTQRQRKTTMEGHQRNHRKTLATTLEMEN